MIVQLFERCNCWLLFLSYSNGSLNCQLFVAAFLCLLFSLDLSFCFLLWALVIIYCTRIIQIQHHFPSVLYRIRAKLSLRSYRYGCIFLHLSRCQPQVQWSVYHTFSVCPFSQDPLVVALLGISLYRFKKNPFEESNSYTYQLQT